ncbi:MAG: HDIG domain-containing protein [Sphingobacteriia bacterium]|nr:HDIG domain-containing protein [Sphingobacteriia bacterium]
MKRNEAIELLHQYIASPNLRKHSYASEVVMHALAMRLGADPEKWALAGLLHDLDVELVNADPRKHGHETVRILSEKGIDPEITEAILLHNEHAAGGIRTTVFHHALAAGETITGLITATALVYPDKKLASVKAKSVKKRMKEKLFAASVNRDHILECEQAGIPLDEFIQISLDAMCSISSELGL